MTQWIHKNCEEHESLLEAISREQERFLTETEEDPALFVANRRYGFISGLLREVRTLPPRIDARYVSDRIDEVLCNRFVGFPIFLVVIYAVFW